MGRAVKDLTGQRFGRLTAVQNLGTKPKGNSKKLAAVWLCRCDCGGTKEMISSDLQKSFDHYCGNCDNPRVSDLKNQRFGRLVAVERRNSTLEGKAIWLFRCDCGTELTLLGKSVRNGHTSSCGCLRREIPNRLRHGHALRHTKVYACWKSLRRRCLNPREKHWKNYGGRGITFDPLWATFENFLADMGEPPSPEHSIDRIDPNGNYTKSNCRWATNKQQGSNKRNTLRYTVNGETLSLSEWSRKTGRPYSALYNRIITNGWPVERALTEK